ncbi:MAG TPA: hypothetical protein VGF12_07015 [Roseateles sp.]|uniref:hypothetical protein n=1 Tax=Roseateles sp. TaxID=1971397 RepID=UPI002ED922F8
MELVQVEYIGAKPIKEDNVAHTGAVWRGEGDVQSVPLAAWPKLAQHTGVWRLAAGEATPSLSSAPSPTPVVATPPPSPSTVKASTVLYGADLPALIEVAGTEIQLGVVVSAAHEASGLTVDEWNALDEADRKARIESLIEAARTEAADEQAKKDPAAKATEAEKPDYSAMTAAQLRAALADKGVEVKGNQTKAKLIELLEGGA